MVDTVETAVEIAESVRRGERKANDVLDAALEAIAERNHGLGAFVHVDEAVARAAAGAVDDAVARGDDPGPFAGVPIGVKDLEDCAGMPTTYGSLAFLGRGPHRPGGDGELRGLVDPHPGVFHPPARCQVKLTTAAATGSTCA